MFNTFEARLVLEGYVRRHDEREDNQAWNVKDDILWQTLSRVKSSKYRPGWKWIVSKIASGNNVPDVLKEAGPWWKKMQAAMKNASSSKDAGADGANRDGDERPGKHKTQLLDSAIKMTVFGSRR